MSITVDLNCYMELSAVVSIFKLSTCVLLVILSCERYSWGAFLLELILTEVVPDSNSVSPYIMVCWRRMSPAMFLQYGFFFALALMCIFLHDKLIRLKQWESKFPSPCHLPATVVMNWLFGWVCDLEQRQWEGITTGSHGEEVQTLALLSSCWA